MSDHVLWSWGKLVFSTTADSHKLMCNWHLIAGKYGSDWAIGFIRQKPYAEYKLMRRNGKWYCGKF